MMTLFKYHFSLGTIFEVKKKQFIVTGIDIKHMEQENIYFCPCEMTFKSVIMGDKIYKKPAQEMYRLRDEGEATYVGFREFPSHFLDSLDK